MPFEKSGPVSLEKPRPVEEIFAAIASYSKCMSHLQKDSHSIFLRDIDRFFEMTSTLQGQMQLQAWSVLALSIIGGSLAIAGACIPKTSSMDPLDPRMGASSDIADSLSEFFKSIEDKLSDSEFLSSTCKTVAQTFQQGFIPVSNGYFQSQTTELEAKREIYRLAFSDAREGKGNSGREITKTSELALSIVQAMKGNGG